MKKLCPVFILFSLFMFFSCASKPSPELSQNDSIASPENEDESLTEIDEPDITDLLPEESESQDENSLEEWDDEGLPLIEDKSEKDDETDSDDSVTESDFDSASKNDEVQSPEDENMSEEESSQSDESQLSATEGNSEERNLSAEITVKNEDGSENAELESEKEENEASEQALENISSEDEIEGEENSEIPPYTPSRSVSMKVSEYLDVTYPGNGWIYMGAVDGSKNITYFGRRLGTENTNFSLQARLPGKKILHFYKNDSLTGQIIDDYLEVTVLEERGNPSTHVEAPAFLMPVKAKRPLSKKTGNENADSAPSVNEVAAGPVQDSFDDEVEDVEESRQKKSKVQKKTETKAEPAALSPEALEEKAPAAASGRNLGELLAAAQNHLSKKDYKNALSEINEYIQNSSDNRDEALFIKGQILEAKSEVQNISEALNSYTTLTKNYPASKFWDKANKRIIYLNRFYLQGR